MSPAPPSLAPCSCRLAVFPLACDLGGWEGRAAPLSSLRNPGPCVGVSGAQCTRPMCPQLWFLKPGPGGRAGGSRPGAPKWDRGALGNFGDPCRDTGSAARPKIPEHNVSLAQVHTFRALRPGPAPQPTLGPGTQRRTLGEQRETPRERSRALYPGQSRPPGINVCGTRGSQGVHGAMCGRGGSTPSSRQGWGLAHLSLHLGQGPRAGHHPPGCGASLGKRLGVSERWPLQPGRRPPG